MGPSRSDRPQGFRRAWRNRRCAAGGALDRHEAASSVAPIGELLGLPASLPRDDQRHPATRPVPPSPPTSWPWRAPCASEPASRLARRRLLGRGDARLERLHEVDHRSDLGRLRRDDLLTTHLRLEERLQITPVLACKLRRLEVACEAVDDLARQIELGLLHLRLLDRFRDLRRRVDVLGEEERLERERVARGRGRGTDSRDPRERSARARRSPSAASPRAGGRTGDAARAVPPERGSTSGRRRSGRRRPP